jgi:hypothetical protein
LLARPEPALGARQRHWVSISGRADGPAANEPREYTSNASTFVDRHLEEDAAQQELYVAAAESHTDEDSGHINRSSGGRVDRPAANEPHMYASNTTDTSRFIGGLLMENAEWHEMVATGSHSDEDNWSKPGLLGPNEPGSWRSCGLANNNRVQAQRYCRRSLRSDASSVNVSETSSMLRALDEHPEQIRERERACEEVFVPHLEEQGLSADLVAGVLALTQQAAHLEAHRHHGAHQR